MIQRKQTLFLLLAALSAGASWVLPLWKGITSSGTEIIFFASSYYLLFLLLLVLVAMALVAIFLFKNRKRQFKISVFGILISAVVVLLEYFQVSTQKAQLQVRVSSYQLGSALPVFMLIFFYLAARGIYRDNKLVKSSDRLR
ncbi:MAG: DUF4293 family protein [Chitinophagaceae bacterium]